MVSINPVPTEQELLAFYAQDYYAYQPLQKAGMESLLSSKLKRLLTRKIVTHNPRFENPGEFLDVGCGSGDYLHLMRAKGWSVRGVEPSSFGALEGSRAGLDIFNGTILEANFASDSFDYVRANHSVEHMPNPVEVLSEFYRIVKPGGKVFVGVPNTESLPYRLFGKYWFHLTIPLHVYAYGVSSISALLRQTGFKVQEVHFNSDYLSLLGSLQIVFNRNSNNRSSQGKLMRSRLLKVIATATERLVDLVGQGDAIEVIAEKPL